MNTRTNKTKPAFGLVLFYFMEVTRTRTHLNAARMSAAGEGGAPRSEFVMAMIAGGNHTEIH